MYVDAAHVGGRAGRRAVRRVVLRRPDRRPRPGRARSGSSPSTWRASRCWSPATRTARLHAAYNVCRHRGSQLCRARAQPARVTRPRCAAPTTPGPTPSTARCCGRRTPSIEDPDAFALHPVGVEAWAGFVFVHLTPASRRAAGRRRSAHAGRDAGQLRPRRPGDRAGAALRGRRQLQGAARELQRVLPLRAGAPRAVAGWCRRSPAAARASTGTTASRTARARGRSR